MIPVFAGVGLLVSQLASSRRLALELGGAIVTLCFLLRVIADTSPGVSWLDWITPLGWAEHLRPFTGAQPGVLLAPVAASMLAAGLFWRLQARRDIGTGLLAGKSTAPPHLALLSSPTRHTLRNERSSLLAWMAGTGAFALVVGVISKSVSSAGISPSSAENWPRWGPAPCSSPSAISPSRSSSSCSW